MKFMKTRLYNQMEDIFLKDILAIYIGNNIAKTFTTKKHYDVDG